MASDGWASNGMRIRSLPRSCGILLAAMALVASCAQNTDEAEQIVEPLAKAIAAQTDSPFIGSEPQCIAEAGVAEIPSTRLVLALDSYSLDIGAFAWSVKEGEVFAEAFAACAPVALARVLAAGGAEVDPSTEACIDNAIPASEVGPILYAGWREEMLSSEQSMTVFAALTDCGVRLGG